MLCVPNNGHINFLIPSFELICTQFEWKELHFDNKRNETNLDSIHFDFQLKLIEESWKKKSSAFQRNIFLRNWSNEGFSIFFSLSQIEPSIYSKSIEVSTVLTVKIRNRSTRLICKLGQFKLVKQRKINEFPCDVLLIKKSNSIYCQICHLLQFLLLTMKIALEFI